MLAEDGCAEVRRATLGAVAISKSSLEALLQRTADVHIEVRIAAFNTLGTRVPCRALSIAQRVALVRNGLTDREERVRNMALNMIVDHWLTPENAGDLFALLELLDVEEEETIGATLVRAMVDNNKAPAMPPNPLLGDEQPSAVESIVDDDGQVVPAPLNLSSTAALYWRVRCEMASAASDWSALEELLPSGAALCRGVLQSAASPFVQRQLLQIGALMDLKDEAGRRMLSTLLRNTLGVLTTEESLIAPMTALLARIHPSEDEYTQIVLETMSDVKDVLEQYEQPEVQEMLAAESERLRANEAQLAKLARRGITEEDADAAVQDLVAETAELRAKEELRAQLEEGTWLRCMSLASTLLQNTTKSTADPRIGGLLQAILLAVRNANPAVREAGVRAVGLFALIDTTAAFAHVPLLVAVVSSDVPAVRVCAAKALVDIMLLHGEPSAMLAAADDADPLIDDLRRAAGIAPLAVLERVLDSAESSELRAIVVEGFAKLLFNNRIEAQARVLARMLFLLSEPGTALDAAVRQCIAVFVPAYAQSSAAHRDALAAACVVALPAIGTFSDGAAIGDTGGYLLSLLRNGGVDGRCVHADVARVVAEQLCAAPSLAVRKEWSKLIGELRLTTGAIDARALSELAYLADQAVGSIGARDRTAKRQVELLDEIVRARCAADGIDPAALSAAARDDLSTELATLRDMRGLSAASEKLADGVGQLAAPSAAAPTRATVGKSTSARRAPVADEHISDDDEDDDEEDNDDDEDEEDDEPIVTSRAPVAATKRAPTLKVAPKEKENAPSNVSRLAGRSALGPKKAMAPAPAPVRSKAAVPRRARDESESEDDDDNTAPPPRATKTTRKAAGRKPIVLSESENEEDSGDESVDELSDSDAFGAASSTLSKQKSAAALFQ